MRGWFWNYVTKCNKTVRQSLADAQRMMQQLYGEGFMSVTGIGSYSAYGPRAESKLDLSGFGTNGEGNHNDECG